MTGSWSEINARVEGRFDCNHTNAEVRCRHTVTGGRQYRRQCTRCGWVGQCIPKARLLIEAGVEADDISAQIDDGLSRRWWTDKMAYRDELRYEAQQRADAEWWASYDEYLASAAWQTRRAKVLLRDQNVCQAALGGCTGRATQVHHLSYRHVGNEPLWELRAICASCHDQVTTTDRSARGVE